MVVESRGDGVALASTRENTCSRGSNTHGPLPLHVPEPCTIAAHDSHQRTSAHIRPEESLSQWLAISYSKVMLGFSLVSILSSPLLLV